MINFGLVEKILVFIVLKFYKEIEENFSRNKFLQIYTHTAAYALVIINYLLKNAYFVLIQFDFVYFIFNLLLWYHLHIFIHFLFP